MKTARYLDDLPPYTPIEPVEVLSARLGLPPEQIVKLDANENPFGMSPRASQALKALGDAHLYPDPESRAMRRALADFCAMPMEQLMAGAGADELIDLLLRVMIEPGDAVLTLPPCFGMYAFDARLNAARVVEVPRKEDFTLDIPAIQAAVRRCQPKVLLLAAPNNPDGGLLSEQEFEFLLKLPLLVVLDEAYIEFSGGGRLGEANSRIRQVQQHNNLVVLRTFSKWAGLAGLRVGYGAFPTWLLSALWKAKQPYNVNAAASSAAIASLEDAELLSQRVAHIRQERQRLFAGLQRVPYLSSYPSEANFVLCRLKYGSARVLKDSLAQRGMLVRYYDTPLLQDCIRISVGLPVHTDRLLEVLSSLLPDAFSAED